MDPATGITKQNSTRCRPSFANRTPMRVRPTGPDRNNTMTVTGKMLKGSGITIAQVFQRRDGITLGTAIFDARIHLVL